MRRRIQRVFEVLAGSRAPAPLRGGVEIGVTVAFAVAMLALGSAGGQRPSEAGAAQQAAPHAPNGGDACQTELQASRHRIAARAVQARVTRCPAGPLYI